MYWLSISVPPQTCLWLRINATSQGNSPCPACCPPTMLPTPQLDELGAWVGRAVVGCVHGGDVVVCLSHQFVDLTVVVVGCGVGCGHHRLVVVVLAVVDDGVHQVFGVVVVVVVVEVVVAAVGTLGGKAPGGRFVIGNGKRFGKPPGKKFGNPVDEPQHIWLWRTW